MKKIFLASAVTVAVSAAYAGDGSDHATNQKDAVVSPASTSTAAEFDILAAHIHQEGNTLTFHMTTNGVAGNKMPVANGVLAGAAVWSYVWPTSLDPSLVGFDKNAGILSMAATNHPDFDDTPLYDENADGDVGNDGGTWHSHWVVLAPTDACGPDSLAVKDIPEGTSPDLPDTWPGLPILIDSPGYTPVFDGPEITINAGMKPGVATGASYDGVTSALRVNENIHAPLLCVSDVFDIASGDLSLPGIVTE